MKLATINNNQITGIKWDEVIQILNAFIGNCDPFDEAEMEMMTAYIELVGILTNLCLAHGYIDAGTEAAIAAKLSRLVEDI